MLSDEALIAEARQGSRAAFESLFDRYRQPVWQFFRRRTPRSDIAEELAQDTFVAVLEGVARYRQSGTFRSYLFGIAYNVLLADHRKAGYRVTEPLDADPVDQTPFSPDQSIWVRAALATLDADAREILMLREYESLSYQEIAGVRGTPLNTVRSQLFRAREALKSALENRASHAVRTTHGGR
ncbi:MAG: sigma-70 family RNA polymerase sigma factor [Acidobacteriota bacterium]